ncbi:MAG TPA: hypothetical protein VJL28_13975 [Gemmatimonadaceae bacterium]|nr:hypothetical protein [Gemmatimonadaceae bacterium]
MSKIGSTLAPPPEEAGPDDLDELDDKDLARILGAFRGQPAFATPTMRYVRASDDGLAPAYVYDEETGMVYILD